MHTHWYVCVYICTHINACSSILTTIPHCYSVLQPYLTCATIISLNIAHKHELLLFQVCMYRSLGKIHCWIFSCEICSW